MQSPPILLNVATCNNKGDERIETRELYISSYSVVQRIGMPNAPKALPGNAWPGEGDPGRVRTALSCT